MALYRLAENACVRLLNFLGGKLDIDDTQNIVNYFTQGVVQGSSKKSPIRFKNGDAVHLESKKLKISQIYSQVGLIKIYRNSIITGYFKNSLSKPEIVGYRMLFAWEEKIGYERIRDEQVPSPIGSKHMVSIARGDIENHVKRILREINENDKELMEERLRSNLVQNKQDIVEVVEKMGQKFDEFLGNSQTNVKISSVCFGVKRPADSFVGREQELDKMSMLLMKGNVALTGIGGVGKSELARKYIYDHQSDYDGNIIWLNSTSWQNLEESIQNLAKEKFQLKELSSASSTVEVIYKILENEKAIFIFDDSKDYNAIEPYLPYNTNNNHKYLITSNSVVWTGFRHAFQTISIVDFSANPEDAYSYIKTALTITGDLQDGDVHELASAVEFLPLALQQATAYIADSGGNIIDYLKKYRQRPDVLLKSHQSGDVNAKTISTTFEIALAKLKEEYTDDYSRIDQILSVISYISPAEIPKNLFLNEIANGDPEKLLYLLKPLKKYSIINEENGMLRIHGLMQVAYRLGCHSEEDALELTLRILANHRSEETTNHVTSVWDHAYKYPKLINKYILNTEKATPPIRSPLGMIIDGQKMPMAKDLAENIPKDEFYRLITESGVWIQNINKELTQILCDKGINETYRSAEGDTLLHMAADQGDLEAVKFLVQTRKILPTEVNKIGYTPLHFAAKGGHLDVIKFLIKGLDVFDSPRSTTFITPLHLASAFNHLNVVKFLGKKADLNAVNEAGHTPLHWAARNGNLEIVQYLIDERKADMYQNTKKMMNLLTYSAKNNHFDLIEYLIDEKHYDTELADEDGWTAVHYATHNKNFQILKKLADNGANLRAKTKHGSSAQHLCARNGSKDILQYLLMDQNLIPSPTDRFSMTPLHIAAENGHEIIYTYLIEKHKCSAIVEDSEGCIPLHYAAKSGQLQAINYFINKLEGAVDPQSHKKSTPLHFAVKYGHLDAVRLLIETYKANPRNRDIEGWGLVHVAVFKGQHKIINYLIENDYTNIEDTSYSGQTALHLAARWGGIDTVKYLIEEEYAKILVYDEEERTPLHYAARSDNLRVVEYLIAKNHPITKKDDGCTPVLLAAKHGHIQTVKYFLENTIETWDVADNDGWNTLHYAARNDNLPVVQFLVEKCGADLTILQNKGQTAVELAEVNGHTTVATYLAKFKSQSTGRSSSICTIPTTYACVVKKQRPPT